MHPRTLQVLHGIEAADKLQKLAEDFKDDGEVLEKLAVAKASVEEEIFSLAKVAVPWGAMGKKLRSGAMYGLGGGAAAAVPIGVTGAVLQNQATEGTKEITEDVRNKVLQTALGLTGIGAGAYGLHKMMGGQTPDVKGLLSQFTGGKRASDSRAEYEDAMEKLATVGVVEGLLEQLPNSMSPATEKMAAEIRALNRGYGMKLLTELLHV